MTLALDTPSAFLRQLWPHIQESGWEWIGRTPYWSMMICGPGAVHLHFSGDSRDNRPPRPRDSYEAAAIRGRVRGGAAR